MHTETSLNGYLSVEHLAQSIKAAHSSISGHVVRTPVIRLPWLDSEDREVWAKLECHQHTGSFKYRGAYNALTNTKSDAVITASAGNHALAVAAAGARLGKRVHLVAPITASELKVNRMMADAEVSLLGHDLYDATKIAMELASLSTSSANEADHLHYVSPYDDLDVAAGAGTIMSEVQEDQGYFDTVVLPLGGGGLAAAVGAWCSSHAPACKVVCSHPEIFGRTFDNSRSIEEQLAKPTAMSYSDGLAVQLARRTAFGSILQETVNQVVQVSEADTAVAISMALRLQSLLVEGAAATTIASMLHSGSTRMHLRGRVLLILTGGNISSSNLACSLVSDVRDAGLRQTIGLRNILPSMDRHGSMKLPAIPTHSRAPSKSLMHSQWHVFSARLQASIKTAAEAFDRKGELAAHLSLETDGWCKSVYQDFQARVSNLADEFDRDVRTSPSGKLKSWVLEERYRVLLQLQASLTSLFDRASAANDQSTRDWFFDLDSQGPASLNYDRYGSPPLRAAEQLFSRALSLGNATKTELLLTSSGMAAYQVILHYLLQALGQGGTAVLPPYIYFEGLEQLQALRSVNVVHASSFAADDIIAVAELYDAKVVFLDPVANVVALPVTDVQRFCRTVSDRPGWDKRLIVIDGTMISGAMPVFDWISGPRSPSLFYYESASKYLQFGLDLQMGGVVVYPRKYDNAMRIIRRNTGTIMYSRAVLLLPPIDFDTFQARMTQLTLNAEKVYERLVESLSNLAEVRFPAQWRCLGWRHGGAVVTIRFLEGGMNNKDSLDACIDLILRAAEVSRVPITKGVSFGFSTPRISSASSMAQDSDPFLRLSMGSEPDLIEDLVSVLLGSIMAYSALFRR